MKRIIPILVMATLILSGYGTSAIFFEEDKIDINFEKSKINSNIFDDELDQYQYDFNFFAPVGPIYISPDINYMAAQSFIPTKHVLTRVELLVAKNSTTTYDYTLAIRDDLSGADLTTLSLSPDHFQTDNFSWVEFDFDDIELITGSTYYMVSYTTDSPDNFYGWGAQLADVYPNGTAWISEDNGLTWEESTDVDLAFATYGTDNMPPNAPDIDGPTGGSAGTSYDYGFTSIDPNDDDIAEYIVDWGDDTGEEIVYGPFESGEEAIASHIWDEKGDYTITVKAKDINGLISDESTLVISMPVTKTSTNKIFMQIIYKITNAFPIIKYLLLFNF